MLLAPELASATDTLLAGKRLVIDNRVPDDERRNKIIISARSEALGIGVPGLVVWWLDSAALLRRAEAPSDPGADPAR